MNAIAVRVGDYIGEVAALLRRNPVRTFALLRSLGVVLLSFWPGLLTGEQQVALIGLAVAWLGIDEKIVREQVTPLEKPSLPSGTVVNVETAAGLPDKTVVLPQ
jgi:hypothetical protein